MQINKLQIKKLFGLFNHSIPFKTEDRITIIHGPNGVGKTTVLKLLVAVFTKRLAPLRQTPYQSIEITFTNKAKLLVERKVEKKASSVSLIFKLIDSNGVKEHIVKEEKARFQRQFPLSMVDDVIPNLSRTGHEVWFGHLYK